MPEMLRISDRFGLGLKQPPFHSADVLLLLTKQGDRIEGRQWDVDHVTETGSWSLIVLEAEEFEIFPTLMRLRAYESGTLVVWQKLDR